MARPRFSPPGGPAPTGPELRKRVRSIRRARARAAKKRLQNLQGSPFRIAHRILEQTTLATWSADRSTPARFWDERWQFKTRSDRVAYEEIEDFRFELVQNRIVTDYLSTRSLAVMIRVWDPVEGRTRWLTASAGAKYHASLDEIDDHLSAWVSSYGRDAGAVLLEAPDGSRDEESYTHVKEIVFLMRPGEATDQWRSYVAGQATRREDAARGKRRKARKRRAKKGRAR